MKKLIALLLALTMVLSLAACGPKNNETNPSTQGTQGTQGTEGTKPTEPTEPTEPASNDVTPDVDASTWGGKLWAAFEAAQAANPSATAEEIATILSTDSSIPFFAMAMAVEPGYLGGFDNEVKGFEQGAMFAPMIGSIPFVGYVFDLAEDADVASFIDGLLADCNLRWNICVAADQAVAGSKGNRVFFVMCPISSGEEEGGNENTEAEVIAPSVEEGTLGEELWNLFLDIAMGDDYTAGEIAFWITSDALTAEMGLASMDIEEGYLAGFTTEISGFEKGAWFGPMIGSVAFTGFVFQLADGADVAAFVEMLETNSDPRWNICVEADQTVCGAYGNTVFFLMCPASV